MQLDMEPGAAPGCPDLVAPTADNPAELNLRIRELDQIRVHLETFQKEKVFPQPEEGEEGYAPWTEGDHAEYTLLLCLDQAQIALQHAIKALRRADHFGQGGDAATAPSL